MLCAVKGVTMKRNDAVAKWILRGAKRLYRKILLQAARHTENPYDQAELFYEALGDEKPYPWKPICEHFKAFNNDRL